MRPFEIGLVLPMGEVFGGGATSRWANIRDLALRAEEIGFDIVWRATSCCGVRRIVTRRGSGRASP